MICIGIDFSSYQQIIKHTCFLITPDLIWWDFAGGIVITYLYIYDMADYNI